MPVTSASNHTLRLLNQLEEISEMISQNTDAASLALEDFRNQQPNAQKPVRAKTHLLQLVIASVRNTFMQQGIDDKKLVSYFKSEKKYDEATQVLLAKARHFFTNGNITEGEKVLMEVKSSLLDKTSPRVQVVYLTRMAFLHGRKGQYDERLKVSLDALDLLKAMGEPDAWNRNISTIFYTNIANCYMANADFDKALPYLQQSLALTQMPDVSTYNKFNVYSYFSVFYEEQYNYLQCISWLEKIIDLLKGDATHQIYLVQSYLLAVVQYHFLFRNSKPGKKELLRIADKQAKYLYEASLLINPAPGSGPYLQLLYTSATFEYQKKNYKESAGLLDKCLPSYIKMNNQVFMRNCYRLAHELYYAWGKQHGDAQKLVKAYEFKQKESELVEAQSMQTHLQKMEAVQVKYNLQQTELKAKLLRLQVETMNKEAQLAALNLQEKVALLDEIKTYVQSLKRKDYDGREFARAVSQKIGAVKITEQDKAVLQQKIDSGNQQLFKTLAETYPTLTAHEVRSCGLIKTGMTNKELSKLYGSGERGYEQLRHRIKKKMKLGREDNLVKHLIEVSARVQ